VQRESRRNRHDAIHAIAAVGGTGLARAVLRRVAHSARPDFRGLGIGGFMPSRTDMRSFIARWLRRGAAAILAICIVACVFHQAFQFAARFLPSTQGIATGVRADLAEHVIASVHGRGFRVPATRMCVLSDRYRYKVGGIAYEAARIHLEIPPDWNGCDAPPPPLVDVRYVPWAPAWAAPAPVLSPILWLFLVVAGLPLLAVLAMPGRVARWSVAFVERLPMPGRG
jgi:hypothetical protein